MNRSGAIIAASVFLLLLAAGGLSSCRECKGNKTPVVPVLLVRIEVSPAEATYPVGRQQAFTATGIYDDEARKDITGTAAWTISDPEIASIGDADGTKGMVSCIAPGAVTVSAVQDGVTGTAALTVQEPVLESIHITPESASVPAGRTQAFTATGTYTDDISRDITSLAIWTSSDQDIAGMDAEVKGLARTIIPGATTVSAELDGVQGTASLEVTGAVLASIEVTPPRPSIPVGVVQDFVATGIRTDGSTTDLTGVAAWSSSDEAVGRFEGETKGQAKGIGPGEAEIRAAHEDLQGTAILTVVAVVLERIVVTPASPTIPVSTTLQLTATGEYSDGSTADLTAVAAWTGSAPAIATVSDEAASKGLVTGVAEGIADITASHEGIQGSTTAQVTAAPLVRISVTPPAPSIAAGGTVQFTATGEYGDGKTADVTPQATWTSSAAAVGSVSDAAATKGLAAGLAAGSTTITAAIAGIEGTATLTVTAATLVSIAIEPASPTVPLGLTQQFIARGTYTDGAKRDISADVTWSSSEGAVASVSNAAGSKGLATALAVGSTTIAAAQDGVEGTTTLTVTAAKLQSIAVEPASHSISVGTTLQYAASGTWSDGTKKDITGDATWSSSAVAAATISNAAGSKGLATAVAAGPATIGAALDGIQGTASLQVTASTLLAIEVAPATAVVRVGGTQAFTATGSYTGGATQDLTGQVTWSSSDVAAASVSNAAGSKGLATGLAAGSTTVAAALEGVQGTATLAVLPPASIFRRCDPNDDRKNDIADAVWVVSFLFLSGYETPCQKAMDCNADGAIELSDALYCILYSFQHGPRPRPPFPDCGIEPEDTGLSCEVAPGCR